MQEKGHARKLMQTISDYVPATLLTFPRTDITSDVWPEVNLTWFLHSPENEPGRSTRRVG